MDAPSIETLKRQNLLKGLNQEELRKLQRLLKKKTFFNNETIITEGEHTNDLYLIEDGEVKVLKLDDDKIQQLPIGVLEGGQMFGEMSFIDGTPRSSTVQTTKSTSVYILSRKDLEANLPDMLDIFNKLVVNISRINIERLRDSNLRQVRTLRSSAHSLELRNDLGSLLIYFLICMGILNGLIFVATYLWPKIPFDFRFYGYWFLMAVPCLALASRFHLYHDQFGITSRNLLKTTLESFVAIAIGVPIIYIISQYYRGSQSSIPEEGWLFWGSGYLLFCAIYELIARGFLLNSLKTFLNDEEGIKSVILSALIVTFIPLVALLNASYGIIMLTLVSNLGLGYLFLRQRNLLGVITMHFFLGIFAKYFQLI